MIVAIADVTDALACKRPYKEAFWVEESNRIISEGKGSHFGPEVADSIEFSLNIQLMILSPGKA